MITVKKELICNIPALHVARQNDEDVQAPLIIFIHGFKSAKEHNLHYAYLLAERGFRVILPDAPLHGERVEKISYDLEFLFWKIVIQSVYEIEMIKKQMVKSSLIDENKIGVVGTSMGGCVTFGALNMYPWIKTGVSLMGNPAYVNFANAQVEQIKQSRNELPNSEEDLKRQINELMKYDISLHPENLRQRPILFWHGQKDKTVPIDSAYQFYLKVKEEYYYSDKERIQFIADPNAGHKVSREGVLNTIDWFETHLN